MQDDRPEEVDAQDETEDQTDEEREWGVLVMKHPIVAALVHEAVDLIAKGGGENYVEFEARRKGSDQEVHCLFQLADGKSPAQVAVERGLAIDRLKQRLDALAFACGKVTRGGMTIPEVVSHIAHALAEDSKLATGGSE